MHVDPIDLPAQSPPNGGYGQLGSEGDVDMGKENKRLLRLIKKHKLTTQKVADLCLVSPNTVQHWRATESHDGHRNMPPTHLQLLEIKLGERTWRGYKKRS